MKKFLVTTAVAFLLVCAAPLSAQALPPATISLWAIGYGTGILYSVSPTDATVTPVGTGTGITSAMAGALDPTSGILYVVDSWCELYTVDITNGTGVDTTHHLSGTIAGHPINLCDSMTIAADGTGYVSVETGSGGGGNSYFATFDPAAGTTAPVGPPMSMYYDWMAIDPATGILYGQNDNSGDLYSMNPATGVETRLGSFSPYSYNLVITDDGTFYSNTGYQLATGTFSAHNGTTVGSYDGALAVPGTNAFFTSTNVFGAPNPATYDSRASLAKTGPDSTVTLPLGAAGLVAVMSGAGALMFSRRRKMIASK